MSKARLALFGAAPAIKLEEHRHWPAVGDSHRQAIARVLDRGLLSGANAPESVALEREFAAFVGARHALLTHSGTSALHLALAAAGVGEGDHVIVPAYSFVATPLAVVQAGAIPIFVDVDERTGLMDPAELDGVLTPRTRAIMPVHVHGCAAQMGALAEFARRHRLLLVEDAAQAHGARWEGKPVGALGTSGGFSLQSSKNFGIGEGGIVVTNDDAIADRANRVRNFGQNVVLADRDALDLKRPLDGERPLESSAIGWMYRGNELSAAFARAALAELPERTAQCQANADRLVRALSGLPGVLPPVIPPGATSVHHKFRVGFDGRAVGIDLPPRALRNAMIHALRAEGLEVVLWQTIPLPAHAIFQRREGFGRGFPWSTDRETDFKALYDLSRFRRTQKMLDSSVVLFSQSCPLIAQPADVVDRYAEAITRVWDSRDDLATWARREGANN